VGEEPCGCDMSAQKIQLIVDAINILPEDADLLTIKKKANYVRLDSLASIEDAEGRERRDELEMTIMSRISGEDVQNVFLQHLANGHQPGLKPRKGEAPVSTKRRF